MFDNNSGYIQQTQFNHLPINNNSSSRIMRVSKRDKMGPLRERNLSTNISPQEHGLNYNSSQDIHLRSNLSTFLTRKEHLEDVPGGPLYSQKKDLSKGYPFTSNGFNPSQTPIFPQKITIEQAKSVKYFAPNPSPTSLHTLEKQFLTSPLDNGSFQQREIRVVKNQQRGDEVRSN